MNIIFSSAYGCRNNVAILDKFEANRISIFSFQKYVFADKVFTQMLVYRKQFLGMQELSQLMQYSLAASSMDIITGDFNYYLLKRNKNKHLDMIVNKRTHISDELIDHVYINKNVVEECFTDVIVEKNCFSDHDAVRIGINKY